MVARTYTDEDGLSSHQLFYYGGSFGDSFGPGEPLNGEEVFDDMYILSIPSFKWYKVSENSPGPRTRHTCHVVNERQMIVLGGGWGNQTSPHLQNNCGPDEFAVFDLSTLKWQNKQYQPAKDAYILNDGIRLLDTDIAGKALQEPAVGHWDKGLYSWWQGNMMKDPMDPIIVPIAIAAVITFLIALMMAFMVVTMLRWDREALEKQQQPQAMVFDLDTGMLYNYTLTATPDDETAECTQSTSTEQQTSIDNSAENSGATEPRARNSINPLTEPLTEPSTQQAYAMTNAPHTAESPRELGSDNNSQSCGTEGSTLATNLMKPLGELSSQEPRTLSRPSYPAELPLREPSSQALSTPTRQPYPTELQLTELPTQGPRFPSRTPYTADLPLTELPSQVPRTRFRTPYPAELATEPEVSASELPNHEIVVHEISSGDGMGRSDDVHEVNRGETRETRSRKKPRKTIFFH